MSELKDYDIMDIEAMDDERLEKSESGKIQVTRVYIKSEADKVIAELKAQKAQAEDDCAYWKMSEGNAVNAMHETEEACMFLTKSERHQKYKRCLAMAKWCRTSAAYERSLDAKPYQDYYERWYFRWLALADQFSDKEAK